MLYGLVYFLDLHKNNVTQGPKRGVTTKGSLAESTSVTSDVHISQSAKEVKANFPKQEQSTITIHIPKPLDTFMCRAVLV